MRTVHILRNKDEKQTLGVLATKLEKEFFVCKTLELVWNNNLSSKSCIPDGEYICKWTKSPLFSQNKGEDVYTYEVIDVPSRGGIRIHSANYFFQLLGCIALGDSHKDINIDGQLDVIHSGNTVAEFNRIMNKEDFKLIISTLV